MTSKRQVYILRYQKSLFNSMSLPYEQASKCNEYNLHNKGQKNHGLFVTIRLSFYGWVYGIR